MRARHCVFLGHKLGVKDSAVFDLKTRETLTSRLVVFHELVFPFQNITSNSNNIVPSASASVIPILDSTFPPTSESTLASHSTLDMHLHPAHHSDTPLTPAPQAFASPPAPFPLHSSPTP